MNQPFHFISFFCTCTNSLEGWIVFLGHSVSHFVAPHLSKHGGLNCDVRVVRRTTTNETKLKNARRPSVRPPGVSVVLTPPPLPPPWPPPFSSSYSSSSRLAAYLDLDLSSRARAPRRRHRNCCLVLWRRRRKNEEAQQQSQ